MIVGLNDLTFKKFFQAFVFVVAESCSISVTVSKHNESGQNGHWQGSSTGRFGDEIMLRNLKPIRTPRECAWQRDQIIDEVVSARAGAGIFRQSGVAP